MKMPLLKIIYARFRYGHKSQTLNVNNNKGVADTGSLIS